MRCSDAARALSVPEWNDDPAALRDHLASCPPCAAFAAGAQRLDHAWTATRPAEPSAEAFDALWDRVCEAESAPAPTLAWRPQARWGVALVSLAAAAALLVAVVARNGRVAPGAGDERPAITAAPVPVEHYNVPPGQVLVLHLEDDGIRADMRPVRGLSETNTVAADFVMLLQANQLSAGPF